MSARLGSSISFAVPVLWAVMAGAAFAEDPREAARAVGEAGQAAAGVIAKDAGQAAAVPGYAGAAVPERDHTANGMEDAARQALADPDDPGGAVGRALVEGMTQRPDAPVPQGDPAVLRADAVTDRPDAPAWGADGIARGSVARCGAALEDAEDGGACGAVTYCVGAGCETVPVEANTGFAGAASRLNMAMEMGGDEFDRGSLRVFTGRRRACEIRWFGWKNCCTDSGFLIDAGLAECTEDERELAEQHAAGTTRYLGEYCASSTWFGICRRWERAWCVFGSRLGRILHSQGRAQLGIGWGSCRGFTVAEIERIDFERVDLSEFTENLIDGGQEPGVGLPDEGAVGAAMRERVHDFYTRSE